MVLAPCKLEQTREMIIWQFAVIGVIGGLAYFCGKMGVYEYIGAKIKTQCKAILQNW